MEISSKSSHSSKMSGSKYKKIMFHVSKFIHGTRTSCSPKRSSKGKSKVLKPTVVVEVHDEEPCSSSSINKELDCEPEYSTIKETTTIEQEPTQSVHSIDETPSAPNNVEELYAKVKKKPKKKDVSSISSASLESVPGTSRQSADVIVHQPDANYNNVTGDVAMNEIQGTKLHTSEIIPEIQTNVDELQTLNFLLKYQQQEHTKPTSQLKLSQPQIYDDSCKVEKQPQKRVRALKKNILPNEHFSHHSPLNFPFSTGKSVQYSHYRSLEDFSSLGAHKEITVNKIWQECQEEMVKFQQNMEQVVEENKILHQQVHSFHQKETKWKEEKENMLILKQDNHLLTQKNSILMQELSSLHEQKDKEVKHLSYHVQRLQEEKNNLIDNLHSTLHEKETLETKYCEMCERNSEVVSYEVHAKAIQENQRMLNDIRKKHLEDMDRILESCRDVENEKNDLSFQVHILKDEIKKLHQNATSLQSSLEEALKIKNLTVTHLEQYKQQNLEMQDLLISLLKLAEEATTERDIALTKAEFQEKQHTQIQGTVVEHSIGIGRLQEHIVNFRRRVNEEMRNVEMR